MLRQTSMFFSFPGMVRPVGDVTPMVREFPMSFVVASQRSKARS